MHIGQAILLGKGLRMNKGLIVGISYELYLSTKSPN